ncbi:sphingosine N-acyltransferase subunit lip1 [Asimina triloba]
MYVPRLVSLARSFKYPDSSYKTLALVSLSKSISSSPPSAQQTLTPQSPPTPPPQTLADLRSRLAAESPSLADFIRLRDNDDYSVEVGTKKKPLPKPKWMKESIPGGSKYTKIKQKLRELNLHTVCEEAKCPNLGECWSGGETGTATATIMILGDTCTRGCRFCNVKTSRTPPPPDPNEPSNVAEAIASWGLDYVVITSVDRDDLSDQGSGHFAETVQKLKFLKPSMLIEALVPDFRGDPSCVEKVAKSGLDVFAHNIETVEELQRAVRDHRANFKQSIDVLKMAKEYAPAGTLTKTSIMLGCGETPDQVVSTMEKVRAAGVDVMTFGQYMRPSKRHMPVSEYVTPEAFESYRVLGMEMGFRYVASGPMVRSSYKAGEFYIKSMIESDRATSAAPISAS